MFFCRKNIEWLVHVSSTEVWEHLLWKSTRVDAQTSVSERVDESQLSFFKVQLQSDDIWPLISINMAARFISFLVFIIHITKTPKMTLWIHFVKILAVHHFPHHSQCPVVVVSYLYVPAVHTWAEALWGQHSHIQPLWVIRHMYFLFFVLNTGAILWHLQFTGGCVWIQSHRSWNTDDCKLQSLSSVNLTFGKSHIFIFNNFWDQIIYIK